jgi:hypothetical protein
MAGLLGFAPYVLIGRRVRAKVENQGVRSIQLGCLGAVTSFFVMVVLLAIARFLLVEHFMLFVLSCIGTFFVGMALYAVWLFRSQGGRGGQGRQK